MSRKADHVKLEQFVSDAFEKVNVKPETAKLLAELIVKDDKWGVASHGVFHLVTYLKKMQAGGIDPQAEPEIVREGDTWAVMDGNHALGYYANWKAMEVCVEKAKKCGIAVVTIFNSAHNGASGLYPVMAAEQGLIGYCATNTFANMSIPNGRGSILGNAPYAYAVPTNGNPVWLDIATSACAMSKVFKAEEGNYLMPDGCIVDSEGIPTRDPSVPGWALAPFAAHKGYGMAVSVDVLTGVLADAEFFGSEKGAVSNDWLSVPERKTKMSHTCVCIDVEQICGLQKYKDNMDRYINYIHSSEKAAGSEKIYLPGEMEWERLAHAEKTGWVELDDVTVVRMAEVAKMLNMDIEACYID
jgi:ureidoglycolate dehydrogenase (NAD+)